MTAIRFSEKTIGTSRYYRFQERHLTLGYTACGFDKSLFPSIFPDTKTLELKQVHSDIILQASQINGEMAGDGIILDKADTVAIIRTADCTPLFFFSDEANPPVAGILHIGWRGLQAGIEKRLLDQIDCERSSLQFILGHSIEGACYEVGEDLVKQFSKKQYIKKDPDLVFHRSGDRITMDVKQGIILSLTEEGILKEQIENVPICTRCHPDLPSYRQDKTSERIYNFMVLK